MPRKAKGPRLYWRADKQFWIIRDTGRPDRSTGTSDLRAAEAALAAYIAGKDIVTGARRPDQLPIAEALDIYGREHAVTIADPVRIGNAIDALMTFWGNLTVADVKGETCRRYAKSRVRTFKPRPPPAVSRPSQPIKSGTIRRELNVLQAAINYCHREGYLLSPSAVTLPEKPPSRDRWLTRDEAAALLWAAYRSPRGKHLARFILLAIYTGTRKEAILGLGFTPSLTSGWIDVERGVMYRKGASERETKKRRKPVRLTRGLLAHCRRWKAMGANWAVQIDGQRVGDIKKAFEGARDRADLEDVSPHTLKHTAITWAIQKGLSVEDAADYFDTSAETIRKVYYHHSPNYQDRALEVLERKL
jgi:integrase